MGACSLALSGTPSFSFCINASNKVYDNSSVIDSDATDHMTPKSQLFHIYTSSPSNKKIAVTNGSLATVASFETYISLLLLSLKMFSIYQNRQPTLFPFKSLLMILNVMLFFFLLIVFFRNRV